MLAFRAARLSDSTFQDLRYALRTARMRPVFFIIVAFTLALGIGSSTAIFSLVNTILLKPLPYPNADRVMMAWRIGPSAASFGVGNWPWNPREYSVLVRTQHAFRQVACFKKETFNLTGIGNPEMLEGVRASAGLFAVLGVRPEIGRTFTSDEDQPGHARVVVLGNRLWRTRFAGNPAVVGQSIDLNGYPHAIVGVMPASFIFPNQDGIPASLDVPKETQLWVPFAMPPGLPGGPNDMGVIGILKHGMSVPLANQDMKAFERRLEEQVPSEKGWASRLVPLAQQTVQDARGPVLLLLGAVTVVLLIACLNVAGLTLNRSLARRHELTLRGALGARRTRLIRQLVTENLLVAFWGGIGGLVLGQAILHLVRSLAAGRIAHLDETALDVHVVAYGLGLTLLTGVAFGLAPAMGATRMNLLETLREGGQRSGGSANAPRIRNALLVGQIALAVVLVIATGLLVQTFWRMLRSNAGFTPTRVITFELPLPGSRYSTVESMGAIYRRVLAQIESVPGVRAVGMSTVVPMGGAPDSTVIRIPGRFTQPGAEQPFANYSLISSGYFPAITAPLLRGRNILDSDTLDTMHVTVINAAMARKYWPGEDPIGRQVGVASVHFPLRTIVGIVADIKHGSLREEPSPEMFVPYTQSEVRVWPSMQAMQFAVRADAEPAAIADGIRSAVHAIDPQLPLARFATLTSLVSDSMTADRMSLLLVASFGGLALVLVCIGMYGVISWSVMQRTRDIGVRIALGAKPGQILAMVLGEAAGIAAAGLGLGLMGALAAGRLMGRFLYGIKPTDPATFAAVSLLLILVALVACYVPARKAVRIDPMIALRYQ